MNNASTVKILGAGAAILDLLARVDDAFLAANVSGEKGGMVMCSGEEQDRIVQALPENCGLTRAPGGSAGNTITGLARMGLATTFLGKIGQDRAGREYLDFLAGLGCSTRSIKQTPDKKTGRCISLITPDSQRTMRTDLGASAFLSPEEITDADFDGVTHFHVEGYLLYSKALFLHLMELAKKHGAVVSMDLSSFEVVRAFHDDLPEILDRCVDVVFANEEEAREFMSGSSGSFDPISALQELGRHCGTTVVKLGKHGAAAWQNGVVTQIPAGEAKAIDTTGAGDLWQAGFLYGYTQGFPLDLCGKIASAAGDEVVQVIGAQIPEDGWVRIRTLCSQLKQR